MRETLSDLGLLVLRVLAGLSMATHGYGKVFGGQVQQLKDGLVGMGLPQPEILAWCAALSEFGGALLVTIGLFTRLGALSMAVTMSVAFFIAHGADPFNVKELAFLYLSISLCLVLTGPGRFSLDGLLFRKK